MVTSMCQFCGEEFHVDDSKRNWQHVELCSDNCRKALAAKKKRDRYVPKEVLDKACVSCGAVFTPAKNLGEAQKYCSRTCYLETKRVVAERKWALDRPRLNCQNCGKEFFPSKFQAGRQKYCSKGCQVSAIHKRHSYKHRRSGKYQSEFRVVKPFVLERDGRCVLCGSSDGLHVHHLDNSGREKDCNNSPDNLVVLCGSCHSAIHRITLAKIDGEWFLDGTIFETIGLEGVIPIKKRS